MKVKDILDKLEVQGEWVNRRHTRDHLLLGDKEQEIESVIICWVATIDIIKQAILENCHFIITHENPFYMSSTSLPTTIMESQSQKVKLLEEYQISIYRCHDLWDLYPEYGVRDQWAKVLQFNFDKATKNSFIRIANHINMSVYDLANHVSKQIRPFYQYGVQVIGDLTKNVQKIAIGTGACTDIMEMYEKGAEACIVSDDGINNWVHVQWAMDYHIPLIVVNHMTSEAAGMKGLCQYLSQEFKDIKFVYKDNDYGIYHIEKEAVTK